MGNRKMTMTPRFRASLDRLHESMRGRPKPNKRKGQPLSPESIAKRSATRTGRKMTMTPRWRAALARNASNIDRRGAVATPEQREANRLRNLGNTHARDATVKGECVYCGGPAKELDHVIPGEPETAPSCRACNASKGARTPTEWLDAGLLGSGWYSARSQSERQVPEHPRSSGRADVLPRQQRLANRPVVGL